MLFVVSCLINDAVGIPCSADGISCRECRAARSEPKRVIEEHQADVASSSLGDKVARPQPQQHLDKMSGGGGGVWPGERGGRHRDSAEDSSDKEPRQRREEKRTKNASSSIKNKSMAGTYCYWWLVHWLLCISSVPSSVRRLRVDGERSLRRIKN